MGLHPQLLGLMDPPLGNPGSWCPLNPPTICHTKSMSARLAKRCERLHHRSRVSSPTNDCSQVCGRMTWLSCWLPRFRQVSHWRWIWGNVHHIHLHQVPIRLPTLALKPRRDVTRSPKRISLAPQKDMCPLKFFKKFMSARLAKRNEKLS